MSDHPIDVALDASPRVTMSNTSEPTTSSHSKSDTSTPRRSARVIKLHEKRSSRPRPYDKPTPAPNAPMGNRAVTSRRAGPQPGGPATPTPRAEASSSASVLAVSLEAEINAVLLLSGRLQPTPAEREQVEYELRASRRRSPSASIVGRKKTPQGAINVRKAAAPYTVPSQPRQRTREIQTTDPLIDAAHIARPSPTDRSSTFTRHTTGGRPRSLPPVSTLLLASNEDAFIHWKAPPRFKLPSSPFFSRHLQPLDEETLAVELGARDSTAGDTLPRTPALSPVSAVSSVSDSPHMPRTPNSAVSSSTMLLLADAALSSHVTSVKVRPTADSGVGLGLQLNTHIN